MKLTKLSLIILIIIVGVAAIIFITKTKSDSKTKTMIASPTSTTIATPTATEYPEELKAKVRSEFISNCETKGHYSAIECNCAADYLAKNYTESELAKIYIQYRTSSEIPAALDSASKVCLDK